MKERINQNTGNIYDKRLLDANEVCYYLSMGRCRGVEFAKEIGAEVRIGRRCLYDRIKIDRYLDEQTEIQEG